MRWILLTAAGLALISPVPAFGCSVSGEYKVPTSMELAADSDAIVLARVSGHIPGETDHDLGEVVLKPELLLAGRSMPTELRIRGYVDDESPYLVASKANELAQANPQAFMGGCNRYVFGRNMLLLLFLKIDRAGKLDVYSPPFSRTLEDVADADALWVRAVRYYLEVARLPANQRKAAMKAEAARLLSTGNPSDALLAKDIQRQIKGKRTPNYD